MGSSSKVKPIDRSNIRTTTIYRSGGRTQSITRPATEEEKDRVVRKSNESFAKSQAESNTEPKESDFVIKTQTKKLEVNQTSQNNVSNNPKNPNASQQFQARLVTQVPDYVITDGGVNQGSNRISYIPQTSYQPADIKSFSTLTATPKTDIVTAKDLFVPEKVDFNLNSVTPVKLSGENFLRLDKYFNDLYKTSNAKAINKQPDGSFSGGNINPTQAGLSFLAGAGRGITYPLYNPDKVVIGVAQTIRDPSSTAQSIKTEAQTNPFGFAGEVFGATEGINLLVKGGIKVQDRVRTFNRKEVARTQLSEPEIISGEKTFPYEPLTPKELAKQFEGGSPYIRNVQKLYGDEQPLGFSASPEPLKTNKVLNRQELQDFSSASEGLYQSPSLSEWFLKIREGKTQEYSFLPNFKSKPTINIVESTNVRTFPENVVSKAKKSNNPIEYLNEYARKNFKEGESFVSPQYTLGKKESEILLKSGTEFEIKPSVTGEKYFVNIEGRRVPVTAIKPTNINIVGGQNKLTSNIKTSEQIRKEFSETSSSLISPAGNPNFLNDFIRSSQLKPSSKSEVTSIFPSKYRPINSIEISGVINPKEYIPPKSQSPSSITPSYDLYPTITPISSGGGSSRKRSSKSSRGGSRISDLISPSPSNSGGGSSGGDSSTPSNIFRESNIVRSSPSRINNPFGRQYTTTLTPAIPTLRTKSKRTRGFDVLVRRKGKFFKENPQPLTRASAINFGTYRVGSDSSATFKLKSVFGKPTTFLRSGNIQNFYKKGNLFIEKKEKRIKRSSPLELQQITYKGIATNKARSKKIKNIFGGGL